MAKKAEKVEPVAPPPIVAGPDEVVIVIADINHLPLREVVIKKGDLAVAMTFDKRTYTHAANTPDGRWIFVPNN